MGLEPRSLEGKADRLPAESALAAFPCLIGLTPVGINAANMKTLRANEWLWVCFVSRYLASRSMKLTPWLTNKVNVLRLADLHSS